MIYQDSDNKDSGEGIGEKDGADIDSESVDEYSSAFFSIDVKRDPTRGEYSYTE